MVCATIFKLRRYPFISSTAPRPIYHPQQRPLSAAPIFPIPSPAPTWIFIDIFNKKLTKCLKYIAFYNFVDDHLIYNVNYNKKNKKKRGFPLSKIIYNLFTFVARITCPSRANASSNRAAGHCQNPDKQNRSCHHNNHEYFPAAFQDHTSY